MNSYLYPTLLHNESSYSYMARAAMLNATGLSEEVLRHLRVLERRVFLEGGTTTVAQAFSIFDVKLPVHPLLVYESFGRARSWRCCPICLKSDLESFGTGYWRWNHQLPATFVCLQHYSLLYETMVPNGLKHQPQFHLPQNLAFSDSTWLPIIDFKAAKSWAIISLAAALTRRTSCWMPIIQLTLRDTYRELGFNVNSQKILVEDWRQYLQDIGGLKAFDLNLLQALFVPGKLIGTKHLQLVPAHIVMIIHRLYGHFNTFHESYSWQEVMSYQGSSQGSGKNKFPGRDFHRKCCIDFLTENPGASRTDFWRSREVTCHWLMRNDPFWLARILPAETKKLAFLQMELFRNK